MPQPAPLLFIIDPCCPGRPWQIMCLGKRHVRPRESHSALALARNSGGRIPASQAALGRAVGSPVYAHAKIQCNFWNICDTGKFLLTCVPEPSYQWLQMAISRSKCFQVSLLTMSKRNRQCLLFWLLCWYSPY